MNMERVRRFQVSTRLGEDEKKFLVAYAEVNGFKSKTGYLSLSMSLYDIVQKYKAAWNARNVKTADGCKAAAEAALAVPSKNIPAPESSGPGDSPESDGTTK